jgi:hypothetical protein
MPQNVFVNCYSRDGRELMGQRKKLEKFLSHDDYKLFYKSTYIPTGLESRSLGNVSAIAPAIIDQ